MSDLHRVRRAFGESAAPWAVTTHDVGEHHWTAFSGTQQIDYNIALVHGGDVQVLVAAAMSALADHRVPGLIMLAGEGLSGAQVMADAGWVAARAMPLMRRHANAGVAADDVREITPADLPRTRELASEAFGLGRELAGAVFTDDLLARDDVVFGGLWEDGDGENGGTSSMVCCGLLCRAEGTSVGWTLATDPSRQRRGYASRLVAGVKHIDAGTRGPTEDLCLASIPGAPLYEHIGFERLEHWQVWTRPRWMLGAS